MSPLKLNKLPDRQTTKITITLNAELNTLLNDYAKAYEHEYKTTETIADLIPHIILSFIKNDRGFKRGKHNASEQGEHQTDSRLPN